MDKAAVTHKEINKRSDYFTEKNYITERTRALRYIHPRILYVRFTVRVGVS